MRISALVEKDILIYGYGREGAATRTALQHKLPNARILVTDAKALPELDGFLSREDAIAQADEHMVVIKTAGIPWHDQHLQGLQAKGAVITSATNLFFAQRKGRGMLIGITGTKGKSTTASLLAHVLATAGMPVQLVGNIGVPMLEQLDAPDKTIFVIELSSYMLSDLAIGPDIALLLNLSQEHMDYHGSVAAYHEAKLRIAQIQTGADTLIYHATIPHIADIVHNMPAGKKIPFFLEEDPLLDALTLKGAHNRENACGVLCVTRLLNVPDAAVRTAFSTFQPLPHRLEEIATIAGVTYINDSISTTPESTIAALNVFADSLGAILLGGMDRGYDFSGMAQRLADLPAVAVLLLPGADRIAQALESAGVAYQKASGIPEAVQWCKIHLHEGQVSLLSPASPSYGYFKNFEERGEIFRRAVMPGE